MSSPNDPVDEIVQYEGDTCVRASAGTGKTHLLVEKFIHLLCMKDGDGKYTRLENILAITFTNKAAEEMRQRVAGRIRKEIASLRKAGDDESLKLILHLRTVRRILSKGYISTVHSFCARLLKENPLEAGLDPHFEILDEDRSYIMRSKSLERFLLEKIRRGEKPVIDLVYRFGFDSEYKFESSLTGMINDVLPLIRATGIDIGDKKSLMSAYRSMLDTGKKTLKKKKEDFEEALRRVRSLASTELQLKTLDRLDALLDSLSPESDFSSLEGLNKSIEYKSFLSPLRFGNDEGKAELSNMKAALDGYTKLVTSSLAVGSGEDFADLIKGFDRYLGENIKGRTLVDFDDLQEKTLELLRRNDPLRDHYRELFRFVLVDEFQDINGLQNSIIEELAAPGEGKLFIVGDMKQAIYGFRGGDLEVFRDAERRIKENGGRIFFQKTNRRSNEGLVDFVNGFFGETQQVIFNDDDKCSAIHGRSEKLPVEVNFVVSDKMNADERRFLEASMIAKRMLSLAEEGTVYGDITILLRKFTYLSLYEAALEHAGIPCSVFRSTGFYRSQEVADIISLLAYIDDPSDLVSWVGVLRSPYSGCSDRTILSLRRDGEGNKVDPMEYLKTLDAERLAERIDDPVELEKFAGFVGWAGRLARLKDRMMVSEIIETCLEESRITGILGAQPDGLQKAANLHKMIETARMMEQDSGITLKNFARHITNLYDREERESVANVVFEDRETVKIMTVHQSKGLEFPVVFMPDLASGTFGTRSPVIFHKTGGLAIKYVDKETMGSYRGSVFDGIQREIEKKEREDSVRVFYVGCTRASERLVLSGNRADKRYQGATFLSDLEEFSNSYPGLFYERFDYGKPVLRKGGTGTTAYMALVGDPDRGFDREVSDRLDPPVAKETGKEVSLNVHQLLAYHRCRREYILRELFRIPEEGGPKGPSMVAGKAKPYRAGEIGSAVHSALERIDFDLPAGLFGKEAEVIIKNRLPGVSKKETGEIVARVNRLYGSELFKKLQSGELRETGREIPFTTRFVDGRDSFLLNGKIDLMVRDSGNRVTIVDYKYASGRDSIDPYRFQLEVYACATARILQIDSVSCAIVFFGGSSVKNIGWDMNGKHLAKTGEKVLDVMNGIAGLEKEVMGFDSRLEHGFPALSGQGGKFSCPNRRCVYLKICEGTLISSKS